MISIFNKRKQKKCNLEWLAVDMHSHLLPGLDDGCKNTDEAIKNMEVLFSLGYSHLITTPHIFTGIYNNNPQGISDRAKVLGIEWCARHSGHFPLTVAAEYMVDTTFSDMISTRGLCSMCGKYVLIEMSYFAESANLTQVIFELQLAGFIPVLAHPERYIYYKNNRQFFRRLKEMGCLLQCNLLSFSGYYGSAIQQAAFYISGQRLIDFLGTDVHNSNHIERLIHYMHQVDIQQLFGKNDIKNSTLLVA